MNGKIDEKAKGEKSSGKNNLDCSTYSTAPHIVPTSRNSSAAAEGLLIDLEVRAACKAKQYP